MPAWNARRDRVHERASRALRSHDHPHRALEQLELVVRCAEKEPAVPVLVVRLRELSIPVPSQDRRRFGDWVVPLLALAAGRPAVDAPDKSWTVLGALDECEEAGRYVPSASV